MRLGAAPSWDAVIHCSSLVIGGQIRVVPDRGGDQGVQTPTETVPAVSAPVPQTSIPITAEDQGLRADLSALQREFQAEKELYAKRHADLLALLQVLQPKPSNP